jgi:hypothetical protein
VLLLVQDFLKYSCTEPMHRNAIEESKSQRLYCRAQRLTLASPSANESQWEATGERGKRDYDRRRGSAFFCDLHIALVT